MIDSNVKLDLKVGFPEQGDGSWSLIGALRSDPSAERTKKVSLDVFQMLCVCIGTTFKSDAFGGFNIYLASGQLMWDGFRKQHGSSWGPFFLVIRLTAGLRCWIYQRWVKSDTTLAVQLLSRWQWKVFNFIEWSIWSRSIVGSVWWPKTVFQLSTERLFYSFCSYKGESGGIFNELTGGLGLGLRANRRGSVIQSGVMTNWSKSEMLTVKRFRDWL